MTSSPVIIWFRQDLRLADQRAVAAACAAGPVVPVFVLDDETPGRWQIGAAQRWWLHHSLAALDADIRAMGARLLLLRGRAGSVIPELAKAIGATRVHALEHFEPWSRVQQAEVGAKVDLVLHDGVSLVPPDRVRSGTDGRYRIFTPWWRALQRMMPPAEPLPAPARITMASNVPEGDGLADWNFLPSKPDWAAGFSERWTPGEQGGWAQLGQFIDVAADYDVGRNLPAEAGSSRLSPHLHHGELSPAQVWHAVEDSIGRRAEPYLREIAWRDFALGLIDQFPDYHERPSRPQFDHFPYRTDGLAAWQRGQTGYPIVDAGMRELWTTGWMHNRVRMITASFFVKHLLGDWREGFTWFWDTLVDADLGNNALGWQWIMGSGVDSSPFNRIFAPVTQGEKFDPAGAYVRRWVPELKDLPDAVVHRPWEADPITLAAAGVRLGTTYPEPIVDHATARARAFAAYEEAMAGAPG